MSAPIRTNPLLRPGYDLYVGVAHASLFGLRLYNQGTLSLVDTLCDSERCARPEFDVAGTKVYGITAGAPVVVNLTTGVETRFALAPTDVNWIKFDGTYLYAAVFSPPRLYKYRLSDLVLTNTYLPGTETSGLAWSPDKSKLYLSIYTAAGGVKVFDVATSTFSAYQPFGAMNSGRGVCVRASDGHIFYAGASVTHLSAAGALLSQVTPTNTLHAPTLRPGTNELWCPAYASNYIEIYDVTGDTVTYVATITTTWNPYTDVCFSPDGVYAYVTSNTGLELYDCDTRNQLDRTTIAGAVGVALPP